MLSKFNEFFTLFCVFPLIFLLGSYLTLRLRFIQFSKFKMSFALLFRKDEGGEGNISHYQAVASVLAGNFGTGNISGMAVALTTGGPGALVWMWAMAFLGAAIQYASCLLAVKYRRKNKEGEYIGGPMYYLTHGLGFKSLGVLFSIVLILAAFSVGNLVQINSMSLPLQGIGVPPWAFGIVIALFVALVIIGGLKRVAKVSAAVVPLMAMLYLGFALIILGLHLDKILPAFGLMIQSAFTGSSVVGGALGFTVLKALTKGFDRGIFATDAGTGTFPILQSSAKTRHPVMDGIVGLVPPFLVMIVCTTTALVILVTGAFGSTELQSTNLVAFAFKKAVGNVGPVVVMVALILFGYTTTLAWAACMDRAVEFLFGKKAVRFFHYLYIAVIPLGAILHVSFVWLLADICITSLLALNLVGLIGLSKEVISESRAFFLSEIKTQTEESR